MAKKKKKKTVVKQPKPKKVKKPKRFTAMSKLIGIIVILFAIIIIAYSMYEMHMNNDLSSLPTLIGGVFAILASYIGFYINMAKAEHIEDKKNQIAKELELIRQDGIITEEERIRQEELIQKLDSMNVTLDEIKLEEEFKAE